MSRRALSPVWAKGPFATKPSDEWQQEFLAHVRKTGQPETFVGIECNPPPEGSRPYILCRFDVDRTKRPDRDMAPCAMCSPYHEKCLENLCLVWYADEAAVRVIGPECGDGLHGGALLNAERKAFERRQRQARAESFLERNLPKMSAWSSALNALKPALAEAKRLHDKLRRDNSEIPKKLRQVKNQAGGLLTVSVVIRKQRDTDEKDQDERPERIGPKGFGKGEGAIDTVTEQFGVLDGAVMFSSSYEPLTEAEQLNVLISSLPQVTAIEDTFDWLCANENLQLFEQVVECMRKIQARSLRLIEQLDSSLAFFSETNIDRMNTWGTHPEGEFDLSASCENGIYTLEHRGRRSRLMPNFACLSLRPSLPMFED